MHYNPLHALAMLYAELDNVAEAAKTYQRMLAMNSNDNQGVRDELLPLLIHMKQWDEAAQLYKNYKDAYSASWHYLGALVDFAKGETPTKIQKKIQRAHAANMHFMPYLRAEKKLPKEPHNDYYSPGALSEALTYIAEVYKSWEEVDGALAWLRTQPVPAATNKKAEGKKKVGA